jgi:hypothetical protein
VVCRRHGSAWSRRRLEGHCAAGGTTLYSSGLPTRVETVRETSCTLDNEHNASHSTAGDLEPAKCSELCLSCAVLDCAGTTIARPVFPLASTTSTIGTSRGPFSTPHSSRWERKLQIKLLQQLWLQRWRARAILGWELLSTIHQPLASSCRGQGRSNGR